MSSLLDGHPHILSTPDSTMMGFYQFWIQYGYLPAERLVDAFVDHFAVIFDARKPSKCPRTGSTAGFDLNYVAMGEDRDEILMVDVEVFKKSIFQYLNFERTVTRREFFLALHIAYADAVGHRVDHEPILAFGLHINYSPSIRMFVEDFPDAFFLHMIRDPIQTAGSFFKHYWKGGCPAMDLGFSVIQQRLKSGSLVLPWVEAQSRVVRLEDLHRRPREVLTAVCGWLGIPWSETLLRSSINGIKWWNDRSSIQVSGFSEVILNQKYTDYLSPFDRVRMASLFYYHFASWGYFQNQRGLGHPIFQILMLPLLMLPFKIEAILFKEAHSIKRFFEFIRGYIKTRKAMMESMIQSIFRQPDPKASNIFS